MQWCHCLPMTPTKRRLFLIYARAIATCRTEIDKPCYMTWYWRVVRRRYNRKDARQFNGEPGQAKHCKSLTINHCRPHIVLSINHCRSLIALTKNHCKSHIALTKNHCRSLIALTINHCKSHIVLTINHCKSHIALTINHCKSHIALRWWHTHFPQCTRSYLVVIDEIQVPLTT